MIYVKNVIGSMIRMSFIMNHIKNNLKTKNGRKLLIIEVLIVILGITVLLIMMPKTITIPSYVALLTIVYIFVSMYMIVKNVTDKSLNSKESKE